MDLRLKDAAVLVTGGSRGIGFAIALGFAAEGARVAIGARDAARLAVIDHARQLPQGPGGPASRPRRVGVAGDLPRPM